MELKNKVFVMKVAVLVFLMGSFTAIVEASSMGTQPLMNDNTDTATKHYNSNSLASKPCCDSCLCTKSIPPQCRCTDIGETCHSACNSCICTRSIPPQCRCTDITDFCYRRCTYSEAIVR